MASLIHQSLQITAPLSLGQRKAAPFFPLLTSVKFSISLTEVNFYIGFLLDDIMWCLKGLGKAGLRQIKAGDFS